MKKQKTESIFSAFTARYQNAKTLRFSLEPVLEQQSDRIRQELQGDLDRVEVYRNVKEAIDSFHRTILRQALWDFQVDWLPLAEARKAAETARRKAHENLDDKKAQAAQKAANTRVQAEETALRKVVYKTFLAQEQLFAKENLPCDSKGLPPAVKFNKATNLLKQILPAFWESSGQDTPENQREAVRKYSSYPLLLDDFMKNRENVYSAEAIATSIPYRLVHENFPKHLSNIAVYDRFRQTVASNPDIDEKRRFCWDQFQNDFQEELANLSVTSLDELFSLDFYNRLLVQDRVTDYKTIIEGLKTGTQITKGLNGYINEYNQTKREKRDKIPIFQPLYKIMLAETASRSETPISFESIDQMCDSIVRFYQTLSCEELPRIKQLLQRFKTWDLTGIFLNRKFISSLSNELFHDYRFLDCALENYYNTEQSPDFVSRFDQANATGKRKLTVEKNRWLNQDGFSLELLNQAVNKYLQILDPDAASRIEYQDGDIITRYTEFLYTGDSDSSEEKSVTADSAKPFDVVIRDRYKTVEALLNDPEKAAEVWKNNQTKILFISNLKRFLDAILAFVQLVRPFCQNKRPEDAEVEFYNEFEPLYEAISVYFYLYDLVRNFVTRKPGETEQIRVCFNHKYNFLGGWVESVTEKSNSGTQYGGYLFRKPNACGEYDYFLGVSRDAHLFSASRKPTEAHKSAYERLDYYQIKGQTVFGAGFKGGGSYVELKQEACACIHQLTFKFAQPQEQDAIQAELARDKSPLTTPKGYLGYLEVNMPPLYKRVCAQKEFAELNQRLISVLVETLKSFKRVPEADKCSRKKYQLFTEAMADIDSICKFRSFSYYPLDQAEWDDAVSRDEDPLLLFKIVNKDLSYAQTSSQGLRQNRGRKNLHTLYFEQLFSGNQNVFDLGTGKIFFRKQSVTYAPQKMKSGFHAKELTDKFNYPIIKDKRFTRDRYLFHLSMTINYLQEKKAPKLNEDVLQTLRDRQDDVRIIGLDRGETNLVYMTIIDSSGRILEQRSLNVIENEYRVSNPDSVPDSAPDSAPSAASKQVDYQSKLAQREEERKKSRQSWQSIGKIADLKQGYLSLAVHEIVLKMIEQDAIVVMENLNKGFKRGRFRFEKQVYQKFETALIEKLKYLAFKDREPEQLGGTLNGFQLVPPVNTLRDVGQQSGFLFYVPAKYTSVIDPATGFVNLLNCRFENIEKARNFIDRFTAIRYRNNPAGPQDSWFEFELDYDRFETKETPYRKKWTVSTHGDKRYRYDHAAKEFKKVNITEELRKLFNKTGITYENERDLKSDLIRQKDADFFRTVLTMIGLTVQLRHKNPKDNEDYILSPVADSAGRFFDSRDYLRETANGTKPTMPQDADANGAYHIALKGLWLLKNNFPKQGISLSDWLKYRQED